MNAKFLWHYISVWSIGVTPESRVKFVHTVVNEFP